MRVLLEGWVIDERGKKHLDERRTGEETRRCWIMNIRFSDDRENRYYDWSGSKEEGMEYSELSEKK